MATGQIDLDGYTHFLLAGNSDVAAVEMDDLPADGQPEAEAAVLITVVFGGEVGVEDALEIFC